MSFAVIKTGGKQYLVEPNRKLRIEKLLAKEGEEVVFDEVLLLDKEGELSIGAPLVKGATVKAKVLLQDKAKKVIVFRYKAKTRRRTKRGHRQPFTQVQITSIEG
ncbi:MAG: 50S ribosomal protein L21 [bacterium]|nr:50S ribosomal protein L21 [bacterium]